MIEEVWTLKKADSEFSIFIRERDGRCMNPKCPNPYRPVKEMTCSHFWPRQIWTTRYNTDNCVSACRGCHIFKWEDQKQGEYRDFMIKRLGMKKYNELKERADDYKRRAHPGIKRREIIKLMEFILCQKN